METLRQSPTDPEFFNNPYPFYDKARLRGDFVFWEDYGLIAAVSHRAVNAVLRDRKMGRTPPPDMAPKIKPHTEAFYRIEAHSMLELEPPRHTRLRGLVLRAFTGRKIQSLAPDIRQLAEELAADLPIGNIDVLPGYARLLPVIVIARLLGVPETMAEQLLQWSNAMVAMYQARRTKEVEIAASQAAEEFHYFLAGYIEARRKNPADDLITHLIAAEEDGERLSTDEMISTAILLLNAGHEATVHTLGNGLAALLANGYGAETVSAKSVAATVEEVLRFDPPLHMFTRWTYDERDIFGTKLPQGVEVAAILGSANRDPRAFHRPEIFDPSRDPKAHLSFGAGLHFCVGAPLARLELQIGLATLFDRFPDLSLAEPPQYANVYHFHGLEGLMVNTGS